MQKRKNHQNNNILSPVFISLKKLDEISKEIPKSAKQFRRMLSHLACNPDAVTNELCIASAAVNLSDVATKNNHLIRQHGIFIDCRKPDKAIKNRFGEHSNQFLWGVYEIPKYNG